MRDFQAVISKEIKELLLGKRSTGFLRYMVRMIAQTLIEAGKHRITKQQIQDMLNAKDKHACRYKADPQGLYLIEVFYNEEDYLKG